MTDKDALLIEWRDSLAHSVECAVFDKRTTDDGCTCGALHKFNRITAALAEKDDGGWIKCSERLPGDREKYLVAFQMGDHVYCRPELLNPAMTGFYVTCNDGDGSPAETAIAWRPLPPLPKGE